MVINEQILSSATVHSLPKHNQTSNTACMCPTRVTLYERMNYSCFAKALSDRSIMLIFVELSGLS